MDFLNKAFAQLKDLFQSMTPGARLTAALLLVVIVISLGYLFTHQVSGTDLYLFGGESFSAGDLQAMEAAFGKAGLKSYRLEGTKIAIPRGDQAVYTAALVDNNALPPQFGSYLTNAVQGDSPFLSSKQREGRIKVAKEKEISLIIRSLPGIEKAAVLYDEQSSPGFNSTKKQSASVYVKALGTQQLDQEQVRKIRLLVKSAFAGMKAEEVTVADSNGPVYAGTDDLSGPGPVTDDPYILRKREHERDWQTKILKALAYVPGVMVTTIVELDKKKFHQSEDVKHDPKTVAQTTTEKEKTRTRDGGGPGGRPGYVPQQPRANSPTTVQTGRSGGSSEEETESESTTVSQISSTRTSTEDVGLTPEWIKATIGIPTSYFVQVWQQRNPAGANEEPKIPDQAALDKIREEETGKVREYVASMLLPAKGNADQTQLVTVKEFQDIAPADIPTPDMSEKAIGWLGEYWPTVGMLGLAGFSLLMLRSMTRAVPSASPVAQARVKSTATGAASAPEEEESEKVNKRTSRLAKFAAGGPSLRDELSELVTEDPDAAANILRAWIGTPQ
jgi:flagellar M-ring protein FliF